MVQQSYKSKIAAIINAANKTGHAKLAKAIEVLVAERSPSQHKRWDEETRKPVIGAITDSLIKQVLQEEDLDLDAQKALTNLPEIQEPIQGINENENELIAVEETGGLRTAKNQIAARQPSDILWSLVRLCSNDKVLRAFFKRRPAAGIRELKDWLAFQKTQIEPIRAVLREALGEAHHNLLWSLAAHASKLYGCSLETLRAEDVYSRAYQFYSDCGLSQNMTFSTSSGLPNPLERHGTDWYLDRYDVDPSNDSVADLLLKNPFRTINFTKGVLNQELLCPRLYVWESKGTGKALQKAWAAVPVNNKDLFYADSVDRLAECLRMPQLRIMEIPMFEPWMKRLTRNGPKSIMISFRGPISKKISHAININYAKASEMEGLYRLVLPVGAAVTQALHQNEALGLFWAAAIGMERYTYENLERRLFKKGFDWQTSTVDGLEEIKPFGTVPESMVQRIAERTVSKLLGL